MREVHRVLRPGGRLILNVAAFDFLKGAHDCAVDVNRRYARPQMKVLLDTAHLQVERLTYWNATLLPPIALLRWISRARSPRNQPRSDFRSLPPFLNSILRDVAAL